MYVLLLQNDSRPGSSLTGDCNLSQIGYDEPNIATSSSSLSSTIPQRSRPKKRDFNTLDPNLTNEVLTTVNDHFKRPIQSDDRFDIFGKNVAMKLRDVTKEQRILAENIINEALFLAEMNTLTISHKISGSSHNELPLISTANREPLQQQYTTLSHINYLNSNTGATETIFQPYNLENNATLSMNEVPRTCEAQNTATAAIYLSQFGQDHSLK